MSILRKRTGVVALIAVALGVLLAGCNLDGPTGSMLVSVNNAVSRNIVGPISMAVVDYQLVVDGVGGTVYDEIVTGNTVVEGLLPGPYDVTVIGRNASGTAIGTGTAAITVEVGSTATANITVLEFVGDGALDLTVSWQPDIVYTPSIYAELTQGLGSPVDVSLDFDVFTDSTGGNPRPGDTTSSTATGWLGESDFDNLAMANGWWTLLVQVLDSGSLSTGAVELVRIVKDYTTTGTIDLTANAASGGIDVLIANDFYEVLALSADLAEGSYTAYDAAPSPVITMQTDDASTATWAIYENGVQRHVELASSVAYTFDQTQYSIDSHVRIDAIAISADGKKAGQLTWEYDIAEGDVQIVATVEMVGGESELNLWILDPVYATGQWYEPLGNAYEQVTIVGPFTAGQIVNISSSVLPDGDYVAIVDADGTAEISGNGTDANFNTGYAAITIPGPTASLALDFGVIGVYGD